ncbi:hypothetical protein [Virgibacillus chiguensis]|nr:hypothetical protein [Virgibacillus chiguensis]
MKKRKVMKAEATYTKIKPSKNPIVLESSPTMKKGIFRRGGCCGKAK